MWPKLHLTRFRLAGLLRGIVSQLHLDLRFPPEAEDAFELEYRQERIDHFRSSTLYAIPIYDAFLLLDYLCLRQSFGLCLVVRLGLVTPLALVCRAVIHRVGRRTREVLFAASPLPGMAGILVLYNARLDLITFGQIALILIMLYSIYSMWPSFWYACYTVFLMVLGNSVFLANSRALNSAQVLALISLFWTAAILTVLAIYSMERQVRMNYQLRLQLNVNNAELVRISNIDSLTGIPNRRYLDSELRVQWKKCLHDGQPISVLMIDLDLFKNFNDQYGHDYGDKVLSLVAKTLRQTLRNQQDILARYGGEEFVVILPNRPLTSTLAIARRLCAAVREAALPLGSNETMARITISIGAASALPSYNSGSTRLLRAADTALYNAKAHGRDCVWPVKEKSL